MSKPFKIVALTYSASQALWGKAALVKSVLVMDEIEFIPNDLDAIMQVAMGKIQPLITKSCYFGVIDGATSEVAYECEAHYINLNKSDVLSAAYIRYVEMQKQGRIAFPKRNPAAFQIPPNVVNAIRTPDGILRHEFDWTRIKAEQIFMLMLIHAISMPQIARPGFMASFCAFFKGQLPEENSNIQQARHTLAKVDQIHQEKNLTTSMAGQQIDENSWYL